MLLFGCSSAPQPAAAPPFRSVVDLKQLMEWVIDPAADVVWESVKTIATEEGTKEIVPRTQAEWDAVRNAAATLAETGNSLMTEVRARDRDRWMKAARRLVDAAEEALKAAEAKNADSVFAAGGRIYDACAACHRQYAPQLNADASAR